MNNTILMTLLSIALIGTISCGTDEVQDALNTAAMCTDGIKNGDEVDVDCGGSCNACPTCIDGIQNGDETGIDCGGSSCEPCATTATVIYSDDFNRANSTHADLGSEWTFAEGVPENGTVMIVDNRLQSIRDEDKDGGMAFMTFGDDITNPNYLASVKILSAEATKSFGLLLRGDFDSRSGYAAIVEREDDDTVDTLTIFKFKNEEGEELSEVNLTLNSNTEYVFEFSTNNGVLNAKIKNSDGVELISISATENEFTSGSVGLAVLGRDGEGALFLDDFKVEEL